MIYYGKYNIETQESAELMSSEGGDYYLVRWPGSKNEISVPVASPQGRLIAGLKLLSEGPTIALPVAQPVLDQLIPLLDKNARKFLDGLLKKKPAKGK